MAPSHGMSVDHFGHSSPTREADVVELRVAAQEGMVSAVRALAAHLAGRADFDIDAIADLRLAVDEACNCLLQVAAPRATMRCVFAIGPDTMDVDVGTVAVPRASVDTSGFGWQLLRALTERPRLETNVHGEFGGLAIRFTTRTDRSRP